MPFQRKGNLENGDPENIFGYLHKRLIFLFEHLWTIQANVCRCKRQNTEIAAFFASVEDSFEILQVYVLVTNEFLTEFY